MPQILYIPTSINSDTDKYCKWLVETITLYFLLEDLLVLKLILKSLEWGKIQLDKFWADQGWQLSNNPL